jgi:hypothetical protein
MDRSDLPTLIFLIVVLAALLCLWRCCSADCESGRLTVCLGNQSKIEVPQCMDFDLSNYSYKFDRGSTYRMIVANKSNPHDVVSFPNDSIISYHEQCEE